jgi:ribosome-associated protein
VTATKRAIELTEIAALAAAEKLANDIVAYDVSDQLAITDAFLLCSGANDRQVRSIIDEVELKLKQAGATLVRREGENEGRWVLLDYNDVVVHVQNSEERSFYALERIWKDCPVIPLPEAATIGNLPGGTGGRPPGGQAGAGARYDGDFGHRAHNLPGGTGGRPPGGQAGAGARYDGDFGHRAHNPATSGDAR